jgi:uncharacterized membrane protein
MKDDYRKQQTEKFALNGLVVCGIIMIVLATLLSVIN